jgi:hypothetical protein
VAVTAVRGGEGTDKKAGAAIRDPIVMDVGKKRRRSIKRLKRGRGGLMGEIEQVVEDVRAEMGDAAEGREIIPVILIYERRPKRRALP